MDSTSAEQMLESALALTREGMAVFPVYGIDEETGACLCVAGASCPNAGKHPMTKHGHTDATTDEEQIRQWWTASPRANIGINCKASNIIVVDTDPRSGGDLSLATLEEDNEPLPATRTVLTSYQDGIRGEHKYFRAPPGEYLVKDSAGAGIDIKFKGYVVAAPSLHRSGIRYEWKDASAPIADLPGWIFSLIKKQIVIRPRPAHKPNSQSICDQYGLRVGQFMPPVNGRWRDGQFEGVHAIHGSTSGTNHVINPATGEWYCRRCGSGGGVLEELAVCDGIIQCHEAKPGCLDDHWSEIFAALETRGIKKFYNDSIGGFVERLLARAKAQEADK